MPGKGKKNKCYVVKVGRNPGIYNDWAEAEKHITGYKGAVYRSFPTKKEAQNYFRSKLPSDKTSEKDDRKEPRDDQEEGMGLTNNVTVQTQTENNLQEEDEWILLDDASSEKSEKNDIQSSDEKLDKLLHDIDLLWDICVENKEKLGKIEGKIYESIACEVSSLPSDFLPDTPQIDFQILDSTAHTPDNEVLIVVRDLEKEVSYLKERNEKLVSENASMREEIYFYISANILLINERNNAENHCNKLQDRINILEHTMHNLKVAPQRNDVNFPPIHYQLPTRNRLQVCRPEHDTENASEENSWYRPKRPLLLNKQAAEIRNANFTSDNRFSPLFNLEENNIDSGDSFNARRCVFSETRDSKDDHVESHNRTNNKTKKLVVIAGDSIVKQVDENKMSRNKSIKVRCFPGAKVEDMADNTKPLLKSQPTTIIVHTGTNNLKSEDAITVRNKLLTLKEHRTETLKHCCNIINFDTQNG